MENLGDYIYILVFVGIAVINFLKKAKEKTATEQMPDFSGNTVPDFMEDFEEEKSIGEHYAAPEPAKTTVYNPLVQPQATAQKPVISKPKQKAANMAIKPETEDFQPIEIDFSDADELKKGIVFAEIFNRKY